MTTLTLPPLPRALNSELQYVSKSAIQDPPLGGPKTRLSRQGDYFTLKLTPQHMIGSQGSSQVMAYLELACSFDKLRVPVPQDFQVADIGSMCVDGAAQVGRILNVRNVPTGFEFQSGQMLNVISGGVYNLHRLISASPVVNSVTNQYSLFINPEIKATALLDGDGLEFAAPVIEGWVTGSPSSVRGFVGAISTTITISEAV